MSHILIMHFINIEIKSVYKTYLKLKENYDNVSLVSDLFLKVVLLNIDCHLPVNIVITQQPVDFLVTSSNMKVSLLPSSSKYKLFVCMRPCHEIVSVHL